MRACIVIALVAISVSSAFGFGFWKPWSKPGRPFGPFNSQETTTTTTTTTTPSTVDPTARAIEPVCDYPNQGGFSPYTWQGDAPFYDDVNNALIFIDAAAKQIYRIFLDDCRFQRMTIGETPGSSFRVSYAIPVEGESDLFLLGLTQELGLVRWPIDSFDEVVAFPTIVYTLSGVTDTTVFNDGKVDPNGNLWTGTFGMTKEGGLVTSDVGQLVRFDENLILTVQDSPIVVANGLEWSNDGSTFYFVDSLAQSIFAYDFDASSGTVSNRRTAFTYTPTGNFEFPDGISIDEDGNLYVGAFLARKFLIVNPNDGSIVESVDMDINSVSSFAFGGPDYSTLYFTTSRDLLTPEQILAEPTEGVPYQVRNLGRKGRAANRVRLSADIIAQLPSA